MPDVPNAAKKFYIQLLFSVFWFSVMYVRLDGTCDLASASKLLSVVIYCLALNKTTYLRVNYCYLCYFLLPFPSLFFFRLLKKHLNDAVIEVFLVEKIIRKCF